MQSPNKLAICLQNAEYRMTCNYYIFFTGQIIFFLFPLSGAFQILSIHLFLSVGFAAGY